MTVVFLILTVSPFFAYANALEQLWDKYNGGQCDLSLNVVAPSYRT